MRAGLRLGAEPWIREAEWGVWSGTDSTRRKHGVARK